MKSTQKTPARKSSINMATTIPKNDVPAAPKRRRVLLKRANRSFELVYLSAPHERIMEIRNGIPAGHVGELAEQMDIAKERLMSLLGLARATVNKKARAHQVLAQDESERVLGVEYLIGQVENMVKESGNPDNFDAAKWVASWLDLPLAALGGQTAASYIDTVEGQKLVSNLLAKAQSEAYA